MTRARVGAVQRSPPKASTSEAEAVQGVMEPTRRNSCCQRYSEALRKRAEHYGSSPLPSASGSHWLEPAGRQLPNSLGNAVFSSSACSLQQRMAGRAMDLRANSPSQHRGYAHFSAPQCPPRPLGWPPKMDGGRVGGHSTDGPTALGPAEGNRPTQISPPPSSPQPM